MGLGILQAWAHIGTSHVEAGRAGQFPNLCAPHFSPQGVSGPAGASELVSSKACHFLAPVTLSPPRSWLTGTLCGSLSCATSSQTPRCAWVRLRSVCQPVRRLHSVAGLDPRAPGGPDERRHRLLAVFLVSFRGRGETFQAISRLVFKVVRPFRCK